MPKIVVSLTSYPARINMVYRVIESLFRQKEKADEIILWLSILEFPNKYNDLPESLKSLIGENGFCVKWVEENIKSHKKYFYALQNTNDITITIDDDMYYSDTMISTLMNSYKKHPHAISARKAYIMMREKEHISPYLTWEGSADEYIDVERMDLCAIGVNGILYPPMCSTKKWFDMASLINYAENQDDLWLKYHEIMDGIPVVYTGMEKKDCVIEGSQVSALYLKNSHGGENDACIKMLLEKMIEGHKIIYDKWFETLMSREEMLFVKRKYYNDKLNSLLKQCSDGYIYICGAGKYAHILYDFIKSCGKEKYIKAFLVSEMIQNEEKEDVLDIKLIKDLDGQKLFYAICGVGEKYKKQIQNALKPYSLCEWINMDLTGIARLLRLEREDSGR